MEYKPRKLEQGEKVYMVEYRTHRPNYYHVGTVQKITPTGRIVVERNGFTNTFTAEGREIGREYNGKDIDWMPFEERKVLVIRENRILSAAKALNAVYDTGRMSDCSYEAVKERLAAYHTKLAAAQKAFDEINSPAPDDKPIG